MNSELFKTLLGAFDCSQVPFLATLAAALRDFYGDYEDDPRGYQHLRFTLRA